MIQLILSPWDRFFLWTISCTYVSVYIWIYDICVYCAYCMYCVYLKIWIVLYCRYLCFVSKCIYTYIYIYIYYRGIGHLPLNRLLSRLLRNKINRCTLQMFQKSTPFSGIQHWNDDCVLGSRRIQIMIPLLMSEALSFAGKSSFSWKRSRSIWWSLQGCVEGRMHTICMNKGDDV